MSGRQQKPSGSGGKKQPPPPKKQPEKTQPQPPQQQPPTSVQRTPRGGPSASLPSSPHYSRSNPSTSRKPSSPMPAPRPTKKDEKPPQKEPEGLAPPPPSQEEQPKTPRTMRGEVETGQFQRRAPAQVQPVAVRPELSPRSRKVHDAAVKFMTIKREQTGEQKYMENYVMEMFPKLQHNLKMVHELSQRVSTLPAQPPVGDAAIREENQSLTLHIGHSAYLFKQFADLLNKTRQHILEFIEKAEKGTRDIDESLKGAIGAIIDYATPEGGLLRPPSPPHDGPGGDDHEDGKPGDGKPVDQPKDGKPGDGKPADQPKDGKSGDGKPADQPKDGKPGDGKQEDQPKDGKPGDKPEDKPKDGKPGDDKPEDKPKDGKPGDDKPKDGKPGDGSDGSQGGGSGAGSNGNEGDGSGDGNKDEKSEGGSGDNSEDQSNDKQGGKSKGGPDDNQGDVLSDDEGSYIEELRSETSQSEPDSDDYDTQVSDDDLDRKFISMVDAFEPLWQVFKKDGTLEERQEFDRMVNKAARGALSSIKYFAKAAGPKYGPYEEYLSRLEIDDSTDAIDIAKGIGKGLELVTGPMRAKLMNGNERGEVQGIDDLMSMKFGQVKTLNIELD